MPNDLVNHFLRWANGIQGKFDKLILPVTKGTSTHAQLKKLKARVEDINLERNSVVHSGSFKNKPQAKKVITEARSIIKELVDIYYDGFD
nr:putative integron gene cassette protein [uncultured bacterium]